MKLLVLFGLLTISITANADFRHYKNWEGIYSSNSADCDTFRLRVANTGDELNMFFIHRVHSDNSYIFLIGEYFNLDIKNRFRTTKETARSTSELVTDYTKFKVGKNSLKIERKTDVDRFDKYKINWYRALDVEFLENGNVSYKRVFKKVDDDGQTVTYSVVCDYYPSN